MVFVAALPTPAIVWRPGLFGAVVNALYQTTYQAGDTGRM
jgi:hypothetical protein